jgi:hypothetical protein
LGLRQSRPVKGKGQFQLAVAARQVSLHQPLGWIAPFGQGDLMGGVLAAGVAAGVEHFFDLSQAIEQLFELMFAFIDI